MTGDTCGPLRRALVVLTEGGLGDLVLSTPIAEALVIRHPQVEITWWAAPAWAPILEDHPFVRRVWAPDVSASFSSLLREIRASRFDAAVLPWTTGRQVLLTRLAGIGLRAGQGDRVAYSHLLTHRIDVRSTRGDAASHWVDIQLDYARALGCACDGLVPRVRVADAGRVAARRALEAQGVTAGEAYCVLHIGKGLPIDDVPWPTRRFVEIGQALQRRHGWRVVLTGSRAEAQTAGAIRAGIGPAAVNLAGRTTIRALAGVLASSAACVAVDSGPMHVAAALDVPVVGLFAIKSDLVARWRPFGPRAGAVGTGDWACGRTCVKTRCPDYECMGHLDVAGAMAALDAAIAGPPLRGT
jgi:ADP-heptose:LPS heptosyltransferase